MKNSYKKLILFSFPWMLCANSITITPDTLTASIQYGEITTETITITNSNNFPVNLDISILEQSPPNPAPLFDADRFEPDNENNRQEMVTDIQYLDEYGNWVDGIRCGTAPTQEGILSFVQSAIENNNNQNRSSRNLVNIQVAWHVLYASNGAGNISNDMIMGQIDVFNDAYAPYDIFFTLVSVDYTMNDNWYNDMDQYESTYKQQLYIDPIHHLNIYSGNMPGLLGWSYLPYQWAEGSYMHGVCILHSSLPGGTSYPYNAGDSATHEVGHYLGLEHTFRNGCSVNNDYVDDTPQENDGNNIYSCNNTDTCPNDPGMDPVHNYMTYTDDACLNQFSNGQGERMEDMIATYRPGLLENPVSPGWIYTTVNVIQVPANGSVDFDITFDGTTLVGGDYAANIYFEESTLDTTVLLPSFLNIMGITNLELSFESIIDSLYPNEFSNNFLEMTYSGSDPLLYQFDSEIDWVTILGGDGSLENGEPQFITFNFNSLFMAPGEYEGDVILNTNMGSLPIPLLMVIMEPLGVADGVVPMKFAVSDNYPNPFNPSTRITISIPDRSKVSAIVFDLSGCKIVTLLNSTLETGVYDLTWLGKNDLGNPVSAGVYILRVDAGKFHNNQKMIYLK
jgi:hypothetical protein